MKGILTYHSVDGSGSPISVSPAAFGEHHRWLTSGRVRTLSLDDLVRTGPDTSHAVAVTFDDGFLNTQGFIEALLADGVPVTIFVVTRHVGGTNAWGGWRTPGIPTLPLLGWEHLERLTRRGVITAAHTRTHPVLTRVADAALQDELLGCRDDLARRLGVRSGHLAYPYGDADGRVVAAAAQHYRWGYTTELRVLPDAAEPPLRLPRLDMYYFQKPGLLEAWGTSRFTRHVAWCRARRLVRAAVAGRPKPSTR